MPATAYASLEQIKAALGTDRAQRMVQGADDAAVDANLTAASMAASGIMNTYLRTSYAVPIDTSTIADASIKAQAEAMLAACCIALMLDPMYPGMDKQPGPFSAAADFWKSWLKDVASRASSLPGFDGFVVEFFAFIPATEPNGVPVDPFPAALFAVQRQVAGWE